MNLLIEYAADLGVQRLHCKVLAGNTAAERIYRMFNSGRLGVAAVIVAMGIVGLRYLDAVAERASECVISLPLHLRLTRDDVVSVTRALRAASDEAATTAAP